MKSVMKYLKNIPEKEYHYFYKNDSDVMTFYENTLKQINPNLSLNTKLKELSNEFSVIPRWEAIIEDHLENAPSKAKTKLLDFFEEKLEAIIEYEDNATPDSEENKDKYWNRYRKVAYQHCMHGDTPTLRDLGYLILKFICYKENDDEIIENVTTIFDVKNVLCSLAEGAALAYYLNDEKNSFVELKEKIKLKRKMSRRIDNYFDGLNNFIQTLPLTEKGKNYIWFDSFVRFYDTLVIGEDGEFTYGIKTEWQLQQFHEQFKSNLSKLRIKILSHYTDNLQTLSKDKALEKINKEIYRIKKKRLLSELGEASPTDWDDFVEKFLLNEKVYIQEIQEEKTLIMTEKSYYQYRYNGELADSDYQLRLHKSKSGSGNIIHPDNKLLFQLFFGLLFDNGDPLFDHAKCLQYHYDRCLLPKEDFIKFTKMMYLDQLDMIKKKSAVNAEIDKEVMTWLNRKAQELINISNDTTPLIKHQANNWIGMAKNLIPQYEVKKTEWLKKRPECDEQMFIKQEIEFYEADLLDPYTVGSEFDRYEAIINKYIAFLKAKPEQNINETQSLQEEKKRKKAELTIDQIALKYVYEKQSVTRKNCNEIATLHGHTSGEKIFQRFTYYSSTANRKGKPTPFTPKKLSNKIKLFEKVIEILKEQNKAQAKDELAILKVLLEEN